LGETRDLLRKAGFDAECVITDISNEDDCAALVKAAVSKFGRIYSARASSGARQSLSVAGMRLGNPQICPSNTPPGQELREEVACQAVYSIDLKLRCFTPSGASASLRILPQVCL
jgi:hypothetical protein